MTFATNHTVATALILSAAALTQTFPALAQNSRNGGGPRPPIVISCEPLTAEEARTLAFMREEEKLARDIYQQLYSKWKLAAFNNISKSEENHFQAIGTLIARYGLADPARDNPAGVYTDSRLTTLYHELLAKGLRSVKDALEVGVLIERTDIADLEDALTATSKLDLKRVYNNLMSGSYNHLEAFEANLEILAPSVGN
ncbi:MAG: DUF2202 domain-containing protein [Bryobacteraceae bacterium]